jgi:AraC-like DNA-binding protein
MEYIEIKNYVKNEVIDRLAKQSSIIFVAAGGVEISLGFTENRSIYKNQIFLVPSGERIFVRFLEDPTSLVFFYLIGNLPVYEYFKVIKNFLPKEDNAIVPLEVNKSILFFMKALLVAWNDDIVEEDYLEKKVAELLFLIKAYYPENLMVKFFRPILNNDLLFKTQILQNRNKFLTVNQLISIFNASPSAFRLRFKRVFGITPSEWLIEERVKWIEHELKTTHKPLKQISEESAFLSISHFNKFVTKHLKSTPAKMRS